MSCTLRSPTQAALPPAGLGPPVTLPPHNPKAGGPPAPGTARAAHIVALSHFVRFDLLWLQAVAGDICPDHVPPSFATFWRRQCE